MVGSSKPHHLKSEYILAEVSCRAEADRQIDLAEGLNSLPRRNAMEWRLAGAMILRLLPPSMSTLEKRVLPMMGSTMSGYRPVIRPDCGT